MFLGVRLQLLFGLNLPIAAGVVPVSPVDPHADLENLARSPLTRLTLIDESRALPWVNGFVFPDSLPLYAPPKRGATETILRLLAERGPLFPREMAELSGGAVDEKGVYVLLKRMDAKGWIRALEWEPALGRGPKRRSYEITDAGRLAQEERRPKSPKMRIILELLATHGDCYGGRLVELSEGRLDSSSIYIFLTRMEKRGLIKTARIEPGDRGTRHYYALNPKGLPLPSK